MDAKLERKLKKQTDEAVKCKEAFDTAKIALDSAKAELTHSLTEAGLKRFTTNAGSAEITRSTSYSVDASKVATLRSVLEKHGIDDTAEIAVKTTFGISAKLRGYLKGEDVIAAEIRPLITQEPEASLSIKSAIA